MKNDVNVLKGEITKILHGKEFSKLTIELKSGEKISSVIPRDLAKKKKLKKGAKVTAAIKASDVMVTER